MTVEINTQVIPDEPLTQEQESTCVWKLCELWTKFENETKTHRERQKRIIRAYECQYEASVLRRKTSTAHLTWMYTSIRTALARLISALIPSYDELFNLSGETNDDNDGCEMMEQYIKIILEQIKASDVLGDCIHQALLPGETVLKVNWLKEKQVRTAEGQVELKKVVDEFGTPVSDESGQPQYEITPKKEEVTLYNNIYLECIPYDAFMYWPLKGDMRRVVVGHEVYRMLDELEDAAEEAGYFNLEKLYELNQREAEEDFVNLDDGQGNSGKQGLKVREYWISRIKLGEQIYRNMIATVVEDKVLIRFEPNPYDYGLFPFIYCPLIKTFTVEGGLQNTGEGIGHKAYEVLRAANFVLNQVIDESKIKLFGFYKYVEDEAFNPGNFVSRAGGLIKVGDLNNLQPINPNMGQLPFALSELQMFKLEFEETLGVPKFAKGIQDDNSEKETATAKRLMAEGSDTLFRYYGFRLNDHLIEPAIRMIYSLIRQYAMSDYEVLYDIARRTQKTRQEVLNPQTGQMEMVEITDPMELIAQLPVIPPLENLDVKVIGFESALDKLDKANQVERFMQAFSQALSQLAGLDPTLKHRFDFGKMAKSYADYLGLDGDFTRDEDEVMARVQQEQAQMEEMMRRAGEVGYLNEQAA